MTRPAYFSDGHTADRQAWLQDMQAESDSGAMRGMQMLIGTLGILAAVAVAIIIADWMTGLDTAQQISAWRAKA